MGEPAAFKATFCNFKNIGTRKCLQLHFEVPIEAADQVYQILGWPDGANPRWVAIALLNEDQK